MAALVFGALASGSVLLAVPAIADQVVGVGQVVPLSVAPGGLRAPGDGRLNGYAFKGAVKGIAFAQAAVAGDQRLAAAAGAELVVVQVDATTKDFSSVGWLDVRTVDGPGPATTLLVGTTRVPLDISGSYDTFAVGIPRGSPVSLELARAGFAQSMDLRSARRVGLAPVALYRDPTEPVVSWSAGPVTQTMAATASPGGAAVTFEVTFGGGDLSFFGPVGAPLPAANGAYLMLDLHALDVPPAGSFNPLVDTTANLPASALHLVLPDRTRLVAGHLGSEFDTTGLLGGTYFFAVPASFTTGRVTIDPGPSVPASQAGASGPTPVTLAFAQPASFDISLPAPGRPGRSTPTPTAVVVRRHHRWNLAAVTALVALPVAAGAAVVFALRRRRQPLTPRPIRHTRAALLAGTPAPTLGGRPTPRGLPPAEPAIIDVRATPLELPAQPSTAPTRLVVLVLGPLEVEGLRASIRRRPVMRMLVFLALNRARPVSADELRYAIAASDEAEPNEATLYTYVSHLRRALPENLLPTFGIDGYQLGAGVELDWALFEELVAQAATKPADRVRLLEAALALVRGEPLAHQSWPGVDQQVHHMIAAIEAVAHQAANDAVEQHDAPRAESAIGRGLLACPSSPLLWEDRLLAAAAGSGYGLERAWTAARQVLGADALLIEAAYRRLQHQQV